MDCSAGGAKRWKPFLRRRAMHVTRAAGVVRAGLKAWRDVPTLYRWATHLSILGLGAAAILASRSPSPAQPVPTGFSDARRQVTTMGASSRGQRPSDESSSGYLVRNAVPRTTDSEAPTPTQAATPTATPTEAPPEIETYIVQGGDTVVGLARRFGITPETILSANRSLDGNPDLLKLGQELKILPVSGVLHEVEEGDTLASIAEEYEVSVDEITGYAANGLAADSALEPGQEIVVPGGKWELPPPPMVEGSGDATGNFVWPTTGRLTQGVWAGHVAIDLGTPTGTPIYASDGGTVVEAGWSNVGYGNYVLIDHGNGFRTRYAHMSKILATRGQTVDQGQQIGLVGSTGNSTGPHLHFEVYLNGVLQSPLKYLP